MSKITRILLVEDDPFISEVYYIGLSEAGYTVDTAVTGLEALDKVKETKPELILLDILIPELSGLEVAHKLRTNPEYEAITIPIIMLTNLGRAQAGARAEEEHVLDYLVKADTTPSLLIERIHAFEEAA